MLAECYEGFMSQAQSGSSNNAPLGIQAAAAATSGGGGGKPTSTTTPAASNAAAGNKPADNKPADNANAAASEDKKKSGNKLFIVVGQVHEFDTYAQAEKFLNADGAPTQYSVLRGKAMKSKQKVSLR